MSLSYPYILGVDGGGTSCRVRLCNSSGRTLGTGQAGSANVRLGADVVFQSILTATDQALEQAGLTRDILPQTAAGFGLAGAISEPLCQSILAYDHPFAEITLLTDAHTACLGAHQGRAGGIVILGTGSCAVFYNGHRFKTLGGWGFPVSDQGSGAWLGLHALRYALQAHEGLLPASALTHQLMQSFNHNGVEVTAWMDAALPRDYGHFARYVIEAAQQQDSVAIQLMQTLADDVTPILNAMQQHGVARIALMGGIAPFVRAYLPERFNTVLVEPSGDAMDGAVLLVQQKGEIQ